MTSSRTTAQVPDEEKLVWNLLIRDFYWVPPEDGTVRVHQPRRKVVGGKPKFQLFEVMFATLLARLRPNYEWSVTPNRADDGTDFVGRSSFLHSEALGIDACITVGGQCKKADGAQSSGRVSESLIKMRVAENPTFFLVALASNVRKERLSEMQSRLQIALNRDCHILQRREIEALLAAQLDALHSLLTDALAPDEAERVQAYLKARSLPRSDTYEILAKAPRRVLAGEPFVVDAEVRGVTDLAGGLRLRWRSATGGDETTGVVSLIGPLGADRATGALLSRAAAHDDNPLASRVQVQFVSYAVGERRMGTLELVTGEAESAIVIATRALDAVRIVENVRPRFYAAPFREVLAALDDASDAARAGAVETVAVIGSGGAGKSRVVEEFSLEVSRRGGSVVLARQANTLDYPRRLFANLLIGLTRPQHDAADLSAAVLSRIAGYDVALAAAGASTVTGLIGSSGKSGGEMDDQHLISILLLLVRAVTRQRTLVLHLQDLHWCTADVLSLLERFLWQLEHVHGGPRTEGSGHGLVLVLEGRVGEEFTNASGGWSTRAFEAMLERLGRPVLRCAPFTPAQSEEFTRRLFEDRHSAHRLTPATLLDLQLSVATLIHRSAAGNPFHILEQLKLLKHRGAVVQNSATGLHYLVRPDAVDEAMPATVAEAIRARWRYLRVSKPALAYLVWATALLSERVPGLLFRQLWSTLAPEHGLEEIEAAEFLNLSPDPAAAVTLRHENYFQTLRQIEIPPEARARVLTVYRGWLATISQPTAQQRFDLARILLASESPDFLGVAELLVGAATQAESTGDGRLARRVLGTLLDEVCWPRPDLFLADRAAFLSVCRNEVRLCRGMMGLGERERAAQRLTALDEQIQRWMQQPAQGGQPSNETLQLARWSVQVLLIRILMNHRQPSRAAELARDAVAEFDARRAAGLCTDADAWNRAELDLCRAHSVALALAGDLDGALEAGNRAIPLAGDDDDGLDALATHANILLVRDPAEAERLLRETLGRAAHLPETSQTRIHLALNLPMCLIMRAHRERQGDPERLGHRLDEALSLLTPLFRGLIELGRLAQAAAAALLIGLVHTLRDSVEDVAWYGDAVNAAARARQMETLWRSHINLASSMYRRGHDHQRVGEHARAAYEILSDTLSPYAEPETSHRFALIRVPLAQAIRFMLLAGDPAAIRGLERFPTLQDCFATPFENGVLRDDRGGLPSEPWLREGEYDYVIY
ncbi:MAG TPA: ATP-binding protein [Longimicrobium sp.]|jgi:hypothetical protein